MRPSLRKDPTPVGLGARGFTLVELLVVVTLIGILATIAVPVLSRARTASVEASTIASLRTLVSAQAAYAETCAGGYFAPNIASLSSRLTRSPYVGPEFRTDTTDRFGYRIRYAAGPVATRAPATCNGVAAGRTRRSYFIGADPLRTGSGQGVRHFGTGQAAVIFESTRRIPAFQSGAPPRPARPIS